MAMEFDVSTFILEIFNFLILIWILQRLFYKPLLAIIAKRKEYIDQTLAEAKTMQQQVEEQCKFYENRQKLWEQEKQAALVMLSQEIDEERRTQLEKLHHDLEDERQKHKVSLSREQQEFQQHAQQLALKNAMQFASTLLKQTSSFELEVKLAQLLLEQLKTQPESLTTCLQALKNQPAIHVNIASAYLLDTNLKEQLEHFFSTLILIPLVFQYQQNEALIAGLRIDIGGSWILQANLQRELTAFAELAYDDFR